MSDSAENSLTVGKSAPETLPGVMNGAFHEPSRRLRRREAPDPGLSRAVTLDTGDVSHVHKSSCGRVAPVNFTLEMNGRQESHILSFCQRIEDGKRF